MVYNDHIAYLKNALEPKCGYPHPELYEWSEKFIYAKDVPSSMADWPWKDRYMLLKRDTQFAKNLSIIYDVIISATSVESCLVKIDLLGISEEALNFAVCYVWMNPKRLFSHNWQERDDEGQQYIFPIPFLPMPKEKEARSWKIVNALAKRVFEKSLPMLELEDFLVSVFLT